MEPSSIKQVIIGAITAVMVAIGVKISDMKLIEYRLDVVESKLDRIMEKMNIPER